MARFTIALLVAAAASTYAQSTVVTISDGVTSTFTLPAFPTLAPSGTTTVTATSVVLSGETTTTTTTTDVGSSSLTIETIAPGSTLTEINSSAASSYVSSLLSEATATATATPSVNSTVTSTATLTSTFFTATTVLATGTGGYLSPNSTNGIPPEFTGAAAAVTFGAKEGVLGLFALGLAALVGL